MAVTTGLFLFSFGMQGRVVSNNLEAPKENFITMAENDPFRTIQQLSCQPSERNLIDENKKGKYVNSLQNLKCYQECQLYFIVFLTVADVAGAIPLLVYGVAVHKELNPISIGLFIIASLMILTSLLGVWGLRTTMFHRIGLRLSSYGAVLLGVTVFVLACSVHQGRLVRYIRDHPKDFRFGEHRAETLYENKNGWAMVLYSISVVNVLRFFFLQWLRSTLLDLDGHLSAPPIESGDLGVPLLWVSNHPEESEMSTQGYCRREEELVKERNWWVENDASTMTYSEDGMQQHPKSGQQNATKLPSWFDHEET